MLVLSRKTNEKIIGVIRGVVIEFFPVDIRGDRVRLGIEAPKEALFFREELVPYGKAATAVREASENERQIEDYQI